MSLHQTVSIIDTHLVVGLRQHHRLRPVQGNGSQLIVLIHRLVVSVGALVVLMRMVVVSFDELVEHSILVTMLRLSWAHHEMVGLLHVHSLGDEFIARVKSGCVKVAHGCGSLTLCVEKCGVLDKRLAVGSAIRSYVVIHRILERAQFALPFNATVIIEFILRIGGRCNAIKLVSLLNIGIYFLAWLPSRFPGVLGLFGAILSSDLGAFTRTLVDLQSEGNLAIWQVLGLHMRCVQVCNRKTAAIISALTGELCKKVAAGRARSSHIELTFTLCATALGALHFPYSWHLREF